jgi:hypothetical protein
MLLVEVRLIDVPSRPKITSFVLQEGPASFRYWNLLESVTYDPGEADDGDVEVLVNKYVNVQLVDETMEDGIVKSSIKKFLAPTAGEDDGGNGSSASVKPKKQTVQQAVDESDDIDLETESVDNDGPYGGPTNGGTAKEASENTLARLQKKLKQSQAEVIRAQGAAQTV